MVKRVAKEGTSKITKIKIKIQYREKDEKMYPTLLITQSDRH